MTEDDRLPFRATAGAEMYDSIKQLPVSVLLENIRSAFNVGSFFRTADAVCAEKIILTGITGAPPHPGVLKTSLGSENTVQWEYSPDSLKAARAERDRGCQLAVIETGIHAVDLFDWMPGFPVCLIFGNEKDGVSPEVAAMCDTHVRIPMLGLKHSLNVATAGGVVLYELLRKRRQPC